MAMTLYLTGSPTRFGEDHFTEDNGFLSDITSALPQRPRTLLVSAAPDDPSFSESVRSGMEKCIRNSGIIPSSLTMLDRSNSSRAEKLVSEADWVILCGGHVPTQNRFIHELHLRELLKDFQGVVMGCSAGSMNCADRVYSHPELEGEALDPDYKRNLRGLGLTDINLIPHYYQVRDSRIDGLRLFEDIIFPDSWGREFYSIPDGGYIRCSEGRNCLMGRGWEIHDGAMRQISEENGRYCFMNLIFISPNFPQTYWHFCAGAKLDGVNVLAIADTPYGDISNELRSSISDYYQVRSLENYDEVYRAVAWYAHKWGKIDWIESNNEYWLYQDARLRTDFNVTTGIRLDHIDAIKSKAEMKKYYALGKIPTARQIKAAEGLKAVLEFTGRSGFPVIAKPEVGVGAGGTYKLESEEQLRQWFASHSDYSLYVIEEFITGLLVSYDAICNSKGKVIFENNSVFPTPVMDIVHEDLDMCYWCNKTVPAKFSQIGRRTIKAFGVTSRFVHLEFFQLDRDRPGLGHKGDYVGLEVNMRPPGGYTPDMMNFAHSTDVFQIWADMVAFDEARKGQGEQNYCAYAGRRDGKTYLHSHEEILQRYGSALCMCERVPGALSDDLGNLAYIVKLPSEEDIEPFFNFVTETTPSAA